VFTRAIVRPPGSNFARGLTTARLGAPDLRKALMQHEEYCRALERCGLVILRLGEDERYPDSTFVEDTAVLLRGKAVLTNPGAPERKGEVESIGRILGRYFSSTVRILAPGTLDAGDVCEAGERVFIGISKRTNFAGAAQLAAVVRQTGSFPVEIDIRDLPGILHLKSALSYLGERRLAIIQRLSGDDAFRDFEIYPVVNSEEYAANSVLIGDNLLIPKGFPVFEKSLRTKGLKVVPLEMSEFRKMDGGLSCLSLRF